ncbi:MAG: Zn-ribbon domain-containing protein [Candidatus Micrarchaeia archaeon]
MPHKCVKCGNIYANNSPELLKGCLCGTRVFLFLRPESMSLKELYEANVDVLVNNQKIKELSQKQPVSIEFEQVPELKPLKTQQVQENTNNTTSLQVPQEPVLSVTQDSENIRVVGKGSYELDLDSLMRGDPLVVKSQSGVYYVKIAAIKSKK